MRTIHAARAGWLRASLLITLLAVIAGGARADTGSDWLAKVPPPPKDVDQANNQCGDGVKDYDAQPWHAFEKQRDAAEQKFNDSMKAKMSSPDAQADMASQMMSQMGDPSAAMAMQQYAQYQAGLGSSAPGVTQDSFFTPPYNDAQDAVAAILKAQKAKLKKCPTKQSEAGPYYVPECENPIDAVANKDKADAANKYLAAVDKAWPQFIKATQDYFKKLGAVPQGVDPKNYQVKLQLGNVPAQELGSVKDVADVAEKACQNALALKTQYMNMED